MSPHWNLQAGLAQRCSLGGPGRGPPTPGGDRLAFRLAQAGWRKVYHITVESSRLLTSLIKVCWGASDLREPEKGGRGDAGALLEGPSEGEGRWQHEPAPSETDSPQPGVLLCSRHTLSCNFAQSTGSAPQELKIA